jgi:hypothetical protein
MSLPSQSQKKKFKQPETLRSTVRVDPPGETYLDTMMRNIDQAKADHARAESVGACLAHGDGVYDRESDIASTWRGGA